MHGRGLPLNRFLWCESNLTMYSSGYLVVAGCVVCSSHLFFFVLFVFFLTNEKNKSQAGRKPMRAVGSVGEQSCGL